MIPLTKQRKAFLDTIAWSEGTTRIEESDDGYNVLVGGTLFDSYARHPHIYVKRYNSTAAGRYQILYRYYIYYKNTLYLEDFGHHAQDQIALQMIRECHGFVPLDAGDFDHAINRVKSRWASLPGAGYNQHEMEMEQLRKKFIEFGGWIDNGHD